MPDLLNDVEKNTPRISIGMVVYNGAAHIRNALDSIASQTYRNIELIVVDGGSTDGTLEILREYADNISILVSEPDRGIYDAMNKVCSLAKGDWLVFLGCDDFLLDSLGDMVGAMSLPDAVYYGNVVWLSSGKIYDGKFSKFRIMHQNICHQSIFYPRAVYKKYFYDLDYPALADHAYNIKVWGEGFLFVYVEVTVSRFNDTGASSFGDDEFEKRRICLIRKAFGQWFAIAEYLYSKIIKLAYFVRGLVELR